MHALPAFCAESSSVSRQIPAPVAWQSLLPGLDLATISHRDPDLVQVTVLRIDPERYEFSLHSVLWGDTPQPLSMSQWAEKYDLTAAINACMFLPDGRSPTAYIRCGDNSTQRSVAEKYGGFFVSGPRDPALPKSAVLDKNVHDWENLLPQYDLVIQNMRLLGVEGQHLWPENGPPHSVAAIGQDGDGHILFLHCRAQVNVYRLVRALLANPALKLHTAIYVEGGGQSSLALRTPGLSRIWTGKGVAGLFLGRDVHYPLPSVIGVRPRIRDNP